MKSRNIIDALGGVGLDLVAESEPGRENRKRAKTIRWTALAAALLAVAVLIPVGVVFANKAPEGPEQPVVATETPKETTAETKTAKEKTPVDPTETPTEDTPVEPTETPEQTQTPIETETPYVAPTGINADTDTLTEEGKYMLRNVRLARDQSEIAPIAIIRLTEVPEESWVYEVNTHTKIEYAKVGFEVLYSQGEVRIRMAFKEEGYFTGQTMPLGDALNAVSYLYLPLRTIERSYGVSIYDYQYADKIKEGTVFLCEFQHGGVQGVQGGNFYDDGTFDPRLWLKADRALVFEDGKLVKDMDNSLHANFYDGNIAAMSHWIDKVLLTEEFEAYRKYWYKDLIEKRPCSKIENGMTVEQIVELLEWYKEFSTIYNDYANQIWERYGADLYYTHWYQQQLLEKEIAEKDKEIAEKDKEKAEQA